MQDDLKILLIDDSPAFARLIVEAVIDNKDSFILDHILFAENAEDGIQKYIQYKPLLVLLDIKIPGKNGVDIAKEIRAYDESANIIFLSNYPKDKDAADLVSKHLVMGTLDKDVGSGFLAGLLGFIIKVGMKVV